MFHKCFDVPNSQQDTNFERHKNSCFPATLYQQIDKPNVYRGLHELLLLKHLHLLRQDSKCLITDTAHIIYSILFIDYCWSCNVTCYRMKYNKILCLPKSYNRESVFCYQREITISSAVEMDGWNARDETDENKLQYNRES